MPHAHGTLVVGLDAAPPPPMQFGPPGTAEFRGLEVDLLQALATALDREPLYEVGLWSGLLERLADGTLDLVCTAATVTAERRRRFALSVGYLATSLVLVSRVDSRIRRAADLAGARVAVRLATVADDWVRAHAPGAELLHSELNTEVYEALRSGAADAAVDDRPIAAHFVSGTPGLCLVADLPDTAAEYAMVFARDNHRLRVAVDAVLRDMARTGELERLRRKWLRELGGTPAW